MKFIEKNKVGGTIKQPTNYLAYVPNNIFPKGPKINFDAEIYKLNSEAERALGELKNITYFVQNPDLFISAYVQKEALLSSQIEGTQCSLDDVIQADENTNEIKPVHEVVNYIKSINQGLRELDTVPFSLRLIREIHKILLNNVRGSNKSPGDFRKSQNWIGPPGCTLEEAAFIPPPPDMVISLMGDLESYYHQDEQLPILIKAAVLHSHFETIHPFIDGNGRLGRLLITFLLCEKKVLEKPLLYLSLFFKEHKSTYYSLLMKVRTDGDWENWIKFFLRGVRNTSHEAVTTAKELVDLRESQRAIITNKIRASSYAFPIYEYLCRNPICPITKIVKELNINYPTVKRTVEQLEKNGIISCEDKKSGRVVSLSEYLNILRRGTEL